jgi:hypothetical protein
MYYEHDLKNNAVAIKFNNKIIITLSLDMLQEVLNDSYDGGYLDYKIKITDMDKFARSILNELNKEDEKGSSRVHLLFDEAIQQAFEDGDGAEEDYDTKK